MKIFKRLFKLLLILILLVPAALFAWMYHFAHTPLALSKSEFTLPHGMTLRAVSRQLKTEGILPSSFPFELLVRVHGKAGQIKAGNYVLESNLTPLALFKKITDGDVTQSEVKLIEGWTFKQIYQELDKHPALKHNLRGLTESQILQQIGAEERVAEGLFFPDTYYFSYGMTDTGVLQRAYKLMKARLDKEWAEREQGLPYTSPYQALIMASIVEKETGRAEERPLIAGVFINRLRLGMKLQTDPTVIYGLGESFTGNLRRRDLLADNEYNTYTKFGLPPTPIAQPGAAALRATLHPAKTDALYFVSRGDGTHVFSSSLQEHNRAVARYQKAR